MDSKQFREAAKQLVDYICDYHDNIRDRDVLPAVQPYFLEKQMPGSAPENGEPWTSVFNDIEKLIMPGVSKTYFLVTCHGLGYFSWQQIAMQFAHVHVMDYSKTSQRLYETKQRHLWDLRFSPLLQCNYVNNFKELHKQYR
uniref:Uncharacterized protein n=1 Tax=Tetranychus urticae TaxID=32264 RepID=T1KA71_TETUR